MKCEDEVDLAVVAQLDDDLVGENGNQRGNEQPQESLHEKEKESEEAQSLDPRNEFCASAHFRVLWETLYVD